MVRGAVPCENHVKSSANSDCGLPWLRGDTRGRPCYRQWSRRSRMRRRGKRLRAAVTGREESEPIDTARNCWALLIATSRLSGTILITRRRSNSHGSTALPGSIMSRREHVFYEFLRRNLNVQQVFRRNDPCCCGMYYSLRPSASVAANIDSCRRAH